MSRPKVGERVGALLSGRDGTVEVIGFGVYTGDEVPKVAVGSVAELCVSNDLASPKIKLDDGRIVYGCECWWASEEDTKARIAKFDNVINVDIDEFRRAYLKNLDDKRQSASQ